MQVSPAHGIDRRESARNPNLSCVLGDKSLRQRPTNPHGLGLGGASSGVRENRGLALAALCQPPTDSDL